MNPEDRITYYLNRASKWNASGVIRHTEFIPGDDGCVSVFATTGMSEDGIWDHGDEFCARGGPPKGRGDTKVARILAIESLTIVRDDDPPRHANITNFPDGVDAQIDVARRIAKAFVPVIVRPGV